MTSHRPKTETHPLSLWRHLNKLRWLTLATVFIMLLCIPAISLYQTYVAAHGYALLSSSQKIFYDGMELLTAPFTDDPTKDLAVIKGNTWSGTFFGLQLSDPLAVVGQIAASLQVYWPFAITALIPIVLTMIFGRFFCGWLCPATFIYELNTNLAAWLHHLGLRSGQHLFDRRLKYLVLVVGLLISALTGAVLVATVYPPAIIGRELYYAIALGGFGSGMVFFMLTLLFDILVARRGFCRYLCPGGALYALLGRYRLFRIQRRVQHCNDCAKCNAICEFGLNPMGDDFGQECNNCTACIAICPTDALAFVVRIRDQPEQGEGHLGARYRKTHGATEQQPVVLR
ncbi:MAG: 4Fe-4S binding protein [Mariprofundales bacterium]|nr:4Fe-4S binding protein [Mariprofundales bacterium]